MFQPKTTMMTCWTSKKPKSCSRKVPQLPRNWWKRSPARRWKTWIRRKANSPQAEQPTTSFDDTTGRGEANAFPPFRVFGQMMFHRCPAPGAIWPAGVGNGLPTFAGRARASDG